MKENRMTLHRPLSPHLPIYKPQKTSTFPIYHRITGAFLATLLLFIIYFLFGDLFPLEKVGFSLGGRALSFALRGWGCSAGLAFTVGLACKALLTGEDLTHMMRPFGEGTSGALSSESPAATPASPSDSLLGRASSSEDSFELQVLLEPWPVTHNLALESSIMNRVRILENENSIFLLGMEKGAYWEEVKKVLQNCTKQGEYNSLIELENRDLQIRELKHSALSLFKQLLTEYPALEEKAPYNPLECLEDFFSEKRDELDTTTPPFRGSAENDARELSLINEIILDIREKGPNSAYIKKILSID